ncbi:hypothetical protein M9H77_20791 [Catharanthus roseus]|uniref:Uncharacterized protein n=1 Tax=Catharanthus roseus TaxID=4058 RepID=A0ACC0AKJ1_CATRO|nr:hypothetical protein M9H77_20791 [Catharanthus roseus]
MEKKTALAFLLVLFVIASDFEVTLGDAFDCYDACSTACVGRGDTREMQRCERKCSIRCSPESVLKKIPGLTYILSVYTDRVSDHEMRN